MTGDLTTENLCKRQRAKSLYNSGITLMDGCRISWREGRQPPIRGAKSIFLTNLLREIEEICVLNRGVHPPDPFESANGTIC